jgi:hypothetical protein
MIESFTEGRVRLRSPLFADRNLAELVSSELMKIGGVEKIEINPRTNGALLEYDRKRLPLSLLSQAAPLFLGMAHIERLPTSERTAALGDILDKLSKILNP